MATELGKAYVQIMPSAKGISKEFEAERQRLIRQAEGR